MVALKVIQITLGLLAAPAAISPTLSAKFKTNFLSKRAEKSGASALLTSESKALLMSAMSADSKCTANSGDRDSCLDTAGAECMFLELDSKNLCLPCQLKSTPIPCPPINSVFAMKKVKSCEMKCAHQNLITKDSPCTDIHGDISASACLSKGVSALTSCMWTTFTTSEGKAKTMCGPCTVMGIGKIPCSAPGDLGPELGSTVDGCVSQCDMPSTAHGLPCDGGLGIPAVTPCRPTAAPPPLGPTPAPDIKAYGIKASKDAPEYFAVPVNAPYGVKQFTESAAAGARAAGWPQDTALPPDSPVVIYGTAPFEGPTLSPQLKVMFGPPPPGIKGVPPPGYGMGTVPPPEQQDAR